jgi:hypothetical protein
MINRLLAIGGILDGEGLLVWQNEIKEHQGLTVSRQPIENIATTLASMGLDRQLGKSWS